MKKEAWIPVVTLTILIASSLIALLAVLAIKTAALDALDLSTHRNALRVPRGAVRIVITLSLLLIIAADKPFRSQSTNDEQLQQVITGTWAVTQIGNELQIAYGSGINFPQYAVLHLTDSYFRLNYGPGSGWGTSVILLPAFWSGGTYYQGAPIDARWQVIGPNLVINITGTIASLDVHSQVIISPPTLNSISAHVTTTVEGDVLLDNRPGEAFKPVILSSMHISSTMWDTQAAFANCQLFSIPESGWIIQPPVMANSFGLIGGTSDWKANAPTIWIVLYQARQVTGWVTSSSDPNDDNVSLWAASDVLMNSWSYEIIATSALDVCCNFLPIILTPQ